MSWYALSADAGEFAEPLIFLCAAYYYTKRRRSKRSSAPSLDFAKTKMDHEVQKYMADDTVTATVDFELAVDKLTPEEAFETWQPPDSKHAWNSPLGIRDSNKPIVLSGGVVYQPAGMTPAVSNPYYGSPPIDSTPAVQQLLAVLVQSNLYVRDAYVHEDSPGTFSVGWYDGLTGKQWNVGINASSLCQIGVFYNSSLNADQRYIEVACDILRERLAGIKAEMAMKQKREMDILKNMGVLTTNELRQQLLDGHTGL